MELINSRYIGLDKFSIFSEIVKATDEENNTKIAFFQKLLTTLLKYEKERKTHANAIYISMDSLCNPRLFPTPELPIKRQTLLNATLFAGYNGDIDTAQKLTSFFPRNEISPNELGELEDYVLEHSMDMNEYFVGEKERLIYNEKENKIEKGYIFFCEKQQGHKKQRLK